MRVIMLILFMSGCVTVRHWTPDQHQDMMFACRATCGKDKMRSYEPLTGTCECRTGRR